MEKTYSIRTVARLLGMTSDAVRFYESKGIISPRRAEDSRYRRFTDDDIRSLFDCTNLTTLGFSLRETETLIHSADRAAFRDALEKRARETQNQIKDLEDSLQKLRSMMELVDGTHEMERKEYGSELFFGYLVEGELNTRLLENGFGPVNERRPLFQCTALWEQDREKLDYGYVIPADKAKERGIDAAEGVRTIPAGNWECIRVTLDNVIDASVLGRVIEQIEKAEGRAPSFACCLLTNRSYENGIQRRTYEIRFLLDSGLAP